ncbi:hypothetical protein ES703_10946 [subsurface metagenome]
MRKSESGIISDLIDGEEKQLDYRKAITAEDEKFKKGNLEARQKKVVKEIMEDLKNNEEGGTEQMKVKGGVKTKTKMATKKVVPPKEVDIKAVQNKCLEFLKELNGIVGDVENIVEETKIGFYNLKRGKKLLAGIKYLACNGQITYSLILPESVKNFSKELPGRYPPGNWNAEFAFTNSNGIKKFLPVIEESLKKFQKPVDKPRPKVFADKKKTKAKKK